MFRYILNHTCRYICVRVKYNKNISFEVRFMLIKNSSFFFSYYFMLFDEINFRSEKRQILYTVKPVLKFILVSKGHFLIILNLLNEETSKQRPLGNKDHNLSLPLIVYIPLIKVYISLNIMKQRICHIVRCSFL